MTPTQEEIEQHVRSGPWKTLEQRAHLIVGTAERAAGSRMNPVLGGGTRIMLSLSHRISDDIDLFITNPAWIGYLTPRLNDDVADMVSGYEEASASLKLRFPEGEIDFVVATGLLNLPSETSPHSGFELEPIAEVMAKKLFFRGWALTARDLFDWWYVARHAPGQLRANWLAKLTQPRHDAIENSLSLMKQSLQAAKAWSNIRAVEKPELEDARLWALAEIKLWGQLALQDFPIPRPRII